MIKVLDLIPITRNIFAPESLSYFSTKKVERGDLVKINLRGKEIFAIVDKIRDAREEKSSLKKTSFKLKAISSVIAQKFFNEESFEIIKFLSKNYIIPPSSLLSALIPKALMSASLVTKSVKYDDNALHQKIALKGSREERLQDLRGIIREHFARKKSIIIVSPRIENIKLLAAELGRGIEEYVYVFSSELSSKKYLTSFNKATSDAHPILILGTPQILFMDREDLETIVIEEEGSRLWRDKSFFSLDFRNVAEAVAKFKKLKLIYSDQVLRIETIYWAEHGQIESKNIPAGRIQSTVQAKIIYMQKKKTGDAKPDPFVWISKELEEEILESITRDEKILLFVNRKGYSSFTICQDCSRPQICQNCSIPLVLHASSKERKFLCHHCLKVQEVPQYCTFCGSWKLKDFGLGIEKIEEEFQKKFPDVKFTRLDKESEKVEQLENIVIATEIIFSRLRSQFDFVAAISIDYLFSIPDFRINESIFRLISELKSRADKKFLIQTRLGESKLIDDCVSGNISSFYQDEIESRKILGYPPFTKLIKLSKEHKNLQALKEEEKKILSYLKDYDPLSFPAFYEKIKGLYRWRILIKIPQQKLSLDLSNMLENVSKTWQISVDPESII